MHSTLQVRGLYATVPNPFREHLKKGNREELGLKTKFVSFSARHSLLELEYELFMNYSVLG